MKKELIARFGPTEYEYSDEALFCIEHHGTLQGYEREFERRLIGLLDGHRDLIGTFLGGLKKEIATEVKMFRP